MPRIPSIASSLAVCILSFGTMVAAQVGGIPPQGLRDPTLQPQPTERRIPVGTSSIGGTVVAADSGRPVGNARVTVSGQVTINAAAAAAALATAQAAGRSGVPGGIPTPSPGLVSRGGVQSVNAAVGLSRTTLTDASGAFSFTRLPAGQFTVSVQQTQYLSIVYGQTRPGGQGKTISLGDGQQITVNVALPRGGVITGIVIGPDGEPQRSAQVRAWHVDISSGFRRLQAAGGAQTDDRGIYRLFGLQPGEYFVSAAASAGDLLMSMQMSSQSDLVERAIATGIVIPPAAAGMTPTVSVSIPPPSSAAQVITLPTYLPTYSPSSLVPSGATPVTVTAGEEKVGVDVRVQLAQASTIQGSLTTALDPGVTLQLSLVSDDGTIDSPQSSTARSDASGSFTFRNVGPGTYSVIAQTIPAQPTITIVNGQAVPQTQPPPALTDAQKMWGRTRVTVAGEPTIPVSITLKPAQSISGVVAFEMAKPPDLTRSRIMVTLVQAPSAQQFFFNAVPQAQVGPDGRFTLTGVMPGRYMLRANSGTMKSAVVAGQDVLDFPLEFTGDRDVTDAVLTVTDQTSELTGALMDSAGKPAVGYTILAVATDNRFWRPGSRRIAMGRPGPDGLYTIRGLPAGTYQLAAVVDLEQGAQYDPEFLRTLARASVPVTITDGGKVTQDLRVK